MGKAKDIVVHVIPSRIATPFVKKWHYSHTVTNNSKLHFGVFYKDRLHGVASFGQGIDKRKTIGFVEGTGWNDYLELNRLAFDPILPRNSESRALAVIIRILRKQAPHVRWLLSYADATQCGDGAIYRAAGFLLTGIKKNNSLARMPDGKIYHKLLFSASFGSNGPGSVKVRYGKTGKYASWNGTKYLRHIGAEILEGYQLRYIYLIDKSCKLTVPVLPYAKIDEIGAGMYRGKKITLAERRKND